MSVVEGFGTGGLKEGSVYSRFPQTAGRRPDPAVAPVGQSLRRAYSFAALPRAG